MSFLALVRVCCLLVVSALVYESPWPPEIPGDQGEWESPLGTSTFLRRDHLVAIALTAHPNATRTLIHLGAGTLSGAFPFTQSLLSQGYTGVFTEHREAELAELGKVAASGLFRAPHVHTFAEFVSPLTVGDVLARARVPVGVDVVALSTRGYDCHLLEAILATHAPKVINVEVNTAFPPPLKFAALYNVDVGDHSQKNGGKSVFWGCSLSHLSTLAARFGYVLLQFDYPDATYVHHELLPKFGDTLRGDAACFEVGLRHARERYPQVSEFRVQHPWHSEQNVYQQAMLVWQSWQQYATSLGLPEDIVSVGVDEDAAVDHRLATPTDQRECDARATQLAENMADEAMMHNMRVWLELRQQLSDAGIWKPSLNVPRILHFVKSDNLTNFFDLEHFLAVKSASYRWNPDIILFHHTVEPVDSEYYMQVRHLMHPVPLKEPRSCGDRVLWNEPAHISDFFRLFALSIFGGLYMDFDMIVFKSYDLLVDMVWRTGGGEKAFIGKMGATMSNAFIVSPFCSQFVNTYLELTQSFFVPGGWQGHSVDLMGDFVINAFSHQFSGLTILHQHILFPGFGRPQLLELDDLFNQTDSSLDHSFTFHVWGVGRRNNKPKDSPHNLFFMASTPDSLLKNHTNYVKLVGPVFGLPDEVPAPYSSGRQYSPVCATLWTGALSVPSPDRFWTIMQTSTVPPVFISMHGFGTLPGDIDAGNTMIQTGVGSWDAAAPALLLKVMASGPSTGWLVDVGAKEGLYPTLVAKKGYRAVAIEAASSYYVHLVRSICATDVQHLAQPVQAAVGRATGQVQLSQYWYPREDLYDSHPTAHTATLDDMVAARVPGTESVTVLRLGMRAYVSEALLGASALLASRPPLFVFIYFDPAAIASVSSPGAAAEALLSLSSYGYAIAPRLCSNLLQGDQGDDALFTTPDATPVAEVEYEAQRHTPQRARIERLAGVLGGGGGGGSGGGGGGVREMMREWEEGRYRVPRLMLVHSSAGLV